MNTSTTPTGKPIKRTGSARSLYMATSHQRLINAVAHELDITFSSAFDLVFTWLLDQTGPAIARDVPGRVIEDACFKQPHRCRRRPASGG